MTSFENNPKQINQFSPWSSLLVFILLFIVTSLVAQFVAIIVAMLFSNVPFDQMATLLQPPFDDNSKQIIYIAQGLSHFLSFTLFGLIFLKKIDRQNVKSFFSGKRFTATQALIAFGATFTFMMFNSIIIEWNMNFEFPEFLKGFEQWARSMEDQLLELTALLSTYDSFGEMLIALFVIGVLPAVGEEIIFRGILQNKLHAIAKNPHVAIWVAAIIFGAFHLQFYGVVPRILLGALFGYLYFYSGSIWYAILAHFINNGLAVIIMYIGPLVDENWDPNALDSEMPLYISITSLVIFILLFKSFIAKGKKLDHA